MCGCRCKESSCKGESVCSSGSAVRIYPKQKRGDSFYQKLYSCHSRPADPPDPVTCLTAARLVSVPRLLLSVMTMAWDSRLDEWYWGNSDLYTVTRNR